jgi:hypothetical protein
MEGYMKRQTKAVMQHKFTFTWDEIKDFGLESEQYDFMETCARENLRASGLEYMGGKVKVELNYSFRDTIFIINI